MDLGLHLHLQARKQDFTLCAHLAHSWDQSGLTMVAFFPSGLHFMTDIMMKWISEIFQSIIMHMHQLRMHNVVCKHCNKYNAMTLSQVPVDAAYTGRSWTTVRAKIFIV